MGQVVSDAEGPLRIGLLGAARIAPTAIVAPAKAAGHRLVAVAARDESRAAAFAASHGVERVVTSYQELVADPGIDVVYNALPNNLHAPWNLDALAAGKHVLSEKPSAVTVEEATAVHAASKAKGKVFMEAYHYAVHPVAVRLREVIDSGEVGEIEFVETVLRAPAPPDDDLRWSWELAGGALMDLGGYCLNAQLVLSEWTGGTPEVTGASWGERRDHPGVDEWVDAELRFPSGATGLARCHMAAHEFSSAYRVIGSKGEVSAANFLFPHADDRLTIRSDKGERVERLGSRPTYDFQLDTLAAAISDGGSHLNDATAALKTTILIDQCRSQAGIPAQLR